MSDTPDDSVVGDPFATEDDYKANPEVPIRSAPVDDTTQLVESFPGAPLLTEEQWRERAAVEAVRAMCLAAGHPPHGISVDPATKEPYGDCSCLCGAFYWQVHPWE